MPFMNDLFLKQIIEAAILTADEPITLQRLQSLFTTEAPSVEQLQIAIASIQADCEMRGIELKEVAEGFTFQAKSTLMPWLKNLFNNPAVKRHSRALIETLALIATQQPITRAEIEAIRGVAVNSQILKTLFEYEWICRVGYKETPGRPSLYATTKKFLEYFNLKSLSELELFLEQVNLPVEVDID